MHNVPIRIQHLITVTALLTALLLTSCTEQPDDSSLPTETSPSTLKAEETVPTEPPVFEGYPFTFTANNGNDITVTLPLDPEWNAELHLCTLSGEEASVHVLLHVVGSGTGVLLEEARVFNAEDGTEYPVTTVDEILSRYVSFANEDDGWRMTVSGADYQIPKAQFSDYSAEQIYEIPNTETFRNFFVENGQLFCRVYFLCAGDGTGFAAETLKIRYDLIDGTVTAAEMTFERPELDLQTETP